MGAALLPCTGVDVTSGQLPSKMEMFRLLMKSEIRESAMKMAAAFQEAGIDMQSKVCLQIPWPLAAHKSSTILSFRI